MKITKLTLTTITILLLAVSFASAEMLMTANPIGKGKWALSLGGIQDVNYINNSAVSLMTIGGYVGYGVMDKLDVYLNAGSANANGMTAPGKLSGTSLGINTKYAILQEGQNMPVTLAIGAGAKAMSYDMNAGLGDRNGNNTQIMAGLGVSKMMLPFVPYAGLMYRSTNTSFSGTNSNTPQTDLTVGSAICWLTQGAVLVEYTMQMLSAPSPAGNYTSQQVGASIAYML